MKVNEWPAMARRYEASTMTSRTSANSKSTTVLESKNWERGTDRSRSPVLNRCMTTMMVRDATTEDRCIHIASNLLADSSALFSVWSAKEGLRFTVNDEPILDIHFWVPTKKTLKNTYKTRQYIRKEIVDRIPAPTGKFLALDEESAILSSHTCYNGENVYALSLLDYSTWELKMVEGREVLVIEIHEYSKNRSAVQYVLYLNKDASSE